MKKIHKNPEHVDSRLVDLLKSAIIDGDEQSLSNAFVYKNIGFDKCEDCGKLYVSCACEGSRITPGDPCEYCKLNYWLCDYDINFNDVDIKQYDVSMIGVEFAKKFLNKDICN